MAIVIKKSGVEEPFDPTKLKNSIAKAAQDTSLSQEKKDEVVEQVSAKVIPLFEDKEKVKSTEIRDAILSELDQVAPDVANSWRAYEQRR